MGLGKLGIGALGQDADERGFKVCLSVSFFV